MKLNVEWRGEDELYRNVTKFERSVEDSTGEFLKIAAEWLVNDIRSNWSSRSPSSRGSAPAVVSGNLDSSVIAEKTGRSSGGQFASTADATSWFVRVDTAKGSDPQGRGGYAKVLEDELKRPFFNPAVERLKAVYEDLAKRTIKV